MRKIHGVIAAASTNTEILNYTERSVIAHYRNFNAPKICKITVTGEDLSASNLSASS